MTDSGSDAGAITNEGGADNAIITTFVGEVFVNAASAEEAKQRAVEWAVLHLSESAVVPEDRPIGFVAGAEAGGDRFAVPLAGTMDYLGMSPDDAVIHTARHIELARHKGSSAYVAMGEFRVFSGPPFETDEG